MTGSMPTSTRKDRRPSRAAKLFLSAANMNVAYDMKPVTRDKGLLLGVDVGSISTNSSSSTRKGMSSPRGTHDGHCLRRPKRGLAEIGKRSAIWWRSSAPAPPGRAVVRRRLHRADIVRNEITACARAAIAIDPGVDTHLRDRRPGLEVSAQW